MTLLKKYSCNRLCILLLCVFSQTGCSPMKLPFVIVNTSDTAATVKYRMTNCDDVEREEWRNEDIPLKLNSDSYFGKDDWQWMPLSADEFTMKQKPLTIDAENTNPKVQRKCIERIYTVNLPSKTILRLTIDDFSPRISLDFLEITGTRGSLRFENINIWQMFRNIDRNYDRIGENFHSYEIFFN